MERAWIDPAHYYEDGDDESLEIERRIFTTTIWIARFSDDLNTLLQTPEEFRMEPRIHQALVDQTKSMIKDLEQQLECLQSEERDAQAVVNAEFDRQYAEATQPVTVDDSDVYITANIAAGKEPF